LQFTIIIIIINYIYLIQILRIDFIEKFILFLFLFLSYFVVILFFLQNIGWQRSNRRTQK